ncbi:MAG: type II toxin-antitoxin system prevent-host-death family antitoxin [Thermomicrobiales bacterium]|nr:type II toxin-antitoxin system prevent-host-death family antitoxin [Thermomicrobiales bacterium]
MVTKRMSDVEARRDFAQVLKEVTSGRNAVIVESNGTAVAAVVPIDLLSRFDEKEDSFFEKMQDASERANLSEEDAMELAIQEISAYRAEKRARLKN